MDIELLRPWAWVEGLSLEAGRCISLNLPELDIEGTASITAVEPSPPIAEGDGEVITGRFVTRQVASTVKITLNGGSEIEGTAIHPMWSLDRQDWIPLGELEEGELLQGQDGPVLITATTVINHATPVYNIEVHGEHVYQVGDLGILVHNIYIVDENGIATWVDDVVPSRVTGQIGYGTSDLSLAAQAHRGTAGVTGGRNVAVFEYRAADGSLQTIARASERAVGHAERIITRELETMGVHPSQVTRIYSELQPCMIPTAPAGCARFIRDTFPKAEVTWSFEYGATAESRAAGVAALRQAAEFLRR